MSQFAATGGTEIGLRWVDGKASRANMLPPGYVVADHQAADVRDPGERVLVA